MDQLNPLRQETAEEESPATNSRCSKINVKLLPYKSFYFLFFSAVGSLFPYLAIFYKQLLLSARQTGVLLGVRPILQLVSSSTWGIVADKTHKSKCIFLISVVGWLCSNFSLSLVKSKTDIEPCHDNGSLTVLDNVLGAVTAGPFLRNGTLFDKILLRRSLDLISSRRHGKWKRNFNGQSKNETDHIPGSNVTWNQVISEVKSSFEDGMTERKMNEESSMGHSPWSLHAVLNLATANGPKSGRNTDRIFIILLIITIVGTLVAAPAIPFADTATLQVLGDQKDFYGKQRQWGALGWGISSFVVGSLVSTIQEKFECNLPNHINYQPCFYAFAALMTLAFIPAIFIRFEGRNLPTVNFTGKIRTLINFDSIVFLLTIQQFGNSWGLIQTFLLWHLQDLGGTQFLFSIVAGIQCLSEVVSYHFAGYAITKLGHYRVLYIGFSFTSLRFILYGLIKNPWLVVPIEIFHGVSTTLIWALAVSFVGLNPGVATTMQGILSGVHWGLGLGGGAILGGILVNAIGSKYTFLGYGVFTLLNLFGFILTQNLRCCVKQTEESQSLLSETARETFELNSIEPENSSTTEPFP
ncbi:major facilitator superfamily domain-containing protein 6-like [Dendronephthya gigantea]|uniref:major facilitator superfamily domain-containing protein 6-like n=1 Tax=Dendronephthya gigantea TaxID=151771 RepID=UPI00106BE7A8|nr:major facilitator superfamily domain-containing protein 6-like [Dendronephthya gigantea]